MIEKYVGTEGNIDQTQESPFYQFEIQRKRLKLLQSKISSKYK